MDVIIDIQGFRDRLKKFLPKEVAIVTLQKKSVKHFIVSPPCKFTELPDDVKLTNSYCTTNLHGIQWFAGECNLDTLHKHLYNTAETAVRIYTRGEDKARYIEEVIGRSIINLENYETPNFVKLENLFKESWVCGKHVEKSMNRFNCHQEHCALRRACLLRKWFWSRVPEDWLEKHYIASDLFYSLLVERVHRSTRFEGHDEVDDDDEGTMKSIVEITDDEDDDFICFESNLT